eukprot:Lithocolla_globosa_v1_NODE_9915_length_655_cov_57.955000.p2 type:complete len:104 gc:universal NODE_9915_length_655_cov_57.955000:571-260(-)
MCSCHLSVLWMYRPSNFVVSSCLILMPSMLSSILFAVREKFVKVVFETFGTRLLCFKNEITFDRSCCACFCRVSRSGAEMMMVISSAYVYAIPYLVYFEISLM